MLLSVLWLIYHAWNTYRMSSTAILMKPDYVTCGTMHHVQLSHMRRMGTTDKYATEMMHEPFLSNLVSTHNQTCNHVSPTSTHNLKSNCASPTIVHGDQTT